MKFRMNLSHNYVGQSVLCHIRVHTVKSFLSITSGFNLKYDEIKINYIFITNHIYKLIMSCKSHKNTVTGRVVDVKSTHDLHSRKASANFTQVVDLKLYQKAFLKILIFIFYTIIKY